MIKKKEKKEKWHLLLKSQLDREQPVHLLKANGRPDLRRKTKKWSMTSSSSNIQHKSLKRSACLDAGLRLPSPWPCLWRLRRCLLECSDVFADNNTFACSPARKPLPEYLLQHVTFCIPLLAAWDIVQSCSNLKPSQNRCPGWIKKMRLDSPCRN